MTFEEFRRSIDEGVPPDNLGAALLGLWHQGRGAWETAHETVQADDGAPAAWVHAHLHRFEGDEMNAGYWFRRAGKPHTKGDLDEEWTAMVAALLDMS
ncbi:MAG: hypothetical protein NXI18_06575 [Alphaproteobacteria bacterium]|nr:hypothetical protein [Alphaproteobacteria bacterium]